MQLTLFSNKIEDYLLETEFVDFHHQEIVRLANHLWRQANQEELRYIQLTYEFVRDEISHSADISENAVTFSASEVLKEKHGICFAKSHLLAALLRYKNIPAGFCYQRLILDEDHPSEFVLHGLNGVFIRETGKWIRLDARGNYGEINAQFSVAQEFLAYPARAELGEQDIPVVFLQSDKNVVKALSESKTRQELWKKLPTELASVK